jgi:hypothetical protein
MFTFAHGHIYHGVCTTEYVHPNAKVYSVCMSQAAECAAGDSRQRGDGLAAARGPYGEFTQTRLANRYGDEQ